MVRNNLPGSAPDYVKAYVFNVSNLAAVRGGAKPVLQELGPYVYRKWRVKEDVTFDRAGDVSFSEWHWFTPVRNGGASGSGAHGGADDGDVVTTVNLPLLGTLATIERDAGRFRRLAELAVHEFFAARAGDGTFEGLFMRRTVRELLFGYQDELLERLAALLPTLRDRAYVALLPNITSRAAALAIPRNTMSTGLRGPRATWRYVRWQGLDEITCWHNHTEAVAGGSDALEFDTGLDAHGSVHVFVPELFRTAKLNATGTITRKGVRLLQYHPDDALAAPDPRFYTEIAGLMNVTACQAVGPSGHGGDAAGPPLFMSFPHFCYVDPVVAAQTVGTRCDPARHDLWLGVEPITGITMAAAKRLQVSSAFDARYPAFDPAVAPTILPIFWAEEVAEVSDEDAERFVGTLYPAMRAKRVLASAWWLAACGFVALAALAGLLATRPRARRDTDEPPQPPADEGALSDVLVGTADEHLLGRATGAERDSNGASTSSDAGEAAARGSRGANGRRRGGAVSRALSAAGQQADAASRHRRRRSSGSQASLPRVQEAAVEGEGAEAEVGVEVGAGGAVGSHSVSMTRNELFETHEHA